MSWSRRQLLDVADFAFDDLEAVFALARRMRAEIDAGDGWLTDLRGSRVALLFAENSTRTRLSFELAARRLGAETFVLDPGGSSMTKGESFVDTVRNLDAIGFDYLVLRHHRAGAAAVAARHFGGHVVNAGDGWHAHPTQALLDYVTLRQNIGELRGRKVAIVGDILHSRVARSNAWSLTRARAEVWLCAPAAWLRAVDGVPAKLTSDLSEALRDADAVMGLRVQKERMAVGIESVGAYIADYQITEQSLAALAPRAVYMHPGPINEGIEVTREVALGQRSLVLEQVRNGVPTRMAVLALIAAASQSSGVAPQTSSATRDLSSVSR